MLPFICITNVVSHVLIFYTQQEILNSGLIKKEIENILLSNQLKEIEYPE